MKKETFYTLALTTLFVLILFVFTVSGCKKELTAKKTTLSANDSTAMVTTVTGGYYNFVAAGTGGNIYLLRGYTDTIYKVDATGTKTAFYVPPCTHPGRYCKLYAQLLNYRLGRQCLYLKFFSHDR